MGFSNHTMGESVGFITLRLRDYHGIKEMRNEAGVKNGILDRDAKLVIVENSLAVPESHIELLYDIEILPLDTYLQD